MTDEERDRLEDEWLECNRRIFDELVSFEDYWKAVDRCREIDAALRAADSAQSNTGAVRDEG